MTSQPPQGQVYDLADQFQQELLRKERRAATAMVKEYGRVWREIKSEIDDLLREYQRSGGQAVGASWFYSFDRLRSLQQQVEKQITRFAQQAEARIQQEQAIAIASAQRHAEAQIRAGLGASAPGYDLVFNRLNPNAIANMVAYNQPGTPLSSLLSQLGPDASYALRDALLRGVMLGEHPLVIVGSIRKRLGENLTRALVIARTETLRSYREAARQSYIANNDVVKGWIWRSGRNTRTCAACWAMDGTVHSLDERLDDHPNGRCTAVPLTKTWAELGIPGIKEVVEARPTGIEAFARLSEGDKLEILGPAKYFAYRDGTIKLEDLVGQRFSPVWGSMRYEKSLASVLGAGQAKTFYHVLPVKPVGDATRLAEIANKLLPEIENVLGVKSYWSGTLTIEQLPGAYGVKNWDCTIGIDRSAIQAGKAVEQATLLHELLHSFSVGGEDRQAFRQARGWEEGVVERAQQVWNTEVYAKIGIDSQPGFFAYRRYTDELEKMRLLIGQAEKEFYSTLMTTRLAERKQFLINLAGGKDDVTREAIERIISDGVLDW